MQVGSQALSFKFHRLARAALALRQTPRKQNALPSDSVGPSAFAKKGARIALEALCAK